MAFEYTLSNGVTARDIIKGLDPAKPVQAAHIGEVWSLCMAGMRYSNQDLDVLGAAWRAMHNDRDQPAEHERLWVERWRNCPGHITCARNWAAA